MILTLTQEYGCGAEEMGRRIACSLGIKLYDKKTLKKTAVESGYYRDMEAFLEGTYCSSLLYAIAQSGYLGEVGRTSIDHMREIAGRESCIILGLGANYILRELDGLVSVFVRAHIKERIPYIRKLERLTPEDALSKAREEDRKSRDFYKYYTGRDWMNPEDYHLMIDTGKIEKAAAAEMIIGFSNKRI